LNRNRGIKQSVRRKDYVENEIFNDDPEIEVKPRPITKNLLWRQYNDFDIEREVEKIKEFDRRQGY